MIEAIKNHRSIRNYKEKPVEPAILDEILEAGIRASNTGNMQIYSMVVTTKQEIKTQLWEQHFKQDMVKQAPVVITFCADFNRFNKWCELRNAKPGYDNFLSFYTASIDAVIAAQNVTVEAESHGLGACYLGTTNYMADKIIEILNLPKGVVPVTTLVLGYPDETPPLTDRLPAEAVVHKETYEDFDETKIDQVYAERDNSEETKGLLKENKTETLAQVFTEKRYTKTNNVHFSQVLLNVLKDQGFMNND
ncbi:MAG: nitroreductase family protein [Bacteroidota bacterium]|nr:nitroreductase family protein [Bacteroidota bacterium]